MGMLAQSVADEDRDHSIHAASTKSRQPAPGRNFRSGSMATPKSRAQIVSPPPGFFDAAGAEESFLRVRPLRLRVAPSWDLSSVRVPAIGWSIAAVAGLLGLVGGMLIGRRSS